MMLGLGAAVGTGVDAVASTFTGGVVRADVTAHVPIKLVAIATPSAAIEFFESWCTGLHSTCASDQGATG